MALNLSALKPGQQIVCTVSADPRTADEARTIERLMRNDGTNRRALARAQRMRRQRVIIYNRGNRDWVKREKTARVVRAVKSATWTMTYRLDMASDLKAVERCITVK
jgi:hypothetical protein